MISNLSNADIARVSGVQRWHMVRMRAPQSLAEHSYNVCMMSVRMAETLNLCPTPKEMVTLMDWALCHDVHEIEHGDVPSPSAHAGAIPAQGLFWTARGGLRQAPGYIRDIVRLMDRVEAYLHYAHHGCNGYTGGIPTKEYLLGRVNAELRGSSKEIQDYVTRLIEEVGPIYCNKSQDWR